MKKITFIFFAYFCSLSVSFAGKAVPGKSQCVLPAGRNLKIGCTRDCEHTYLTTYKNAILEAAASFGYTVEFVTLQSGADIEQVDGFFSPGGHDIDPKYFSKNLTDAEAEHLRELHAKYANKNADGTPNNNPDFPIRDAREFNILDRYMNDSKFAKTPFLGVCYGMQMLAAVVGLPLYVDLGAQLPEVGARRNRNDEVLLQPSSQLRDHITAGKDKILGFKNHHQAVDLEFLNNHRAQFADVEITGTSNGGKLPEVMELKNRPALGIQFHAERTTVDIDGHLGPYRWLLGKTCMNAGGTRGE